MIEAGPVILPRDGCRQFNQLCGGELCAQFVEERFRYFNRSLSHVIGVVQNEFLQIRKQPIYPVVLQGCDLFW